MVLGVSLGTTELLYLTHYRGKICDGAIDNEYLHHDCPLDQTLSKMSLDYHAQMQRPHSGALTGYPKAYTKYPLQSRSPHFDTGSI